MSENMFTLEDLDAALEKEYAPFEFAIGSNVFTLLPLLRVDKDRRKAAQDALKVFEKNGDGTISVEADDADDDDLEAMTNAIKVVLAKVTKGPDYVGQQLVDLLGDDFLRHMKLMQLWSEKTQPGEASSSPN